MIVPIQGRRHTCVMRQQENEVPISLAFHFHLDRGTEVSQQGGDRLAGHVCKDKLLLLLVQSEDCAGLA